MNTTTAIANFRNVQNIFRTMALLHLTDHWWPEPATVTNGAKYDFIIVGGGTAGCVVASRLAEKRKFKVLLVEAGGYPTFEASYPAYFAYVRNSPVDWNVTSTPDDTMQYHTDGVARISQGKMLGGTSAANYMTYIGGLPSDYDNWAKMLNDSSWSSKKVLPLSKRSEKVIDKEILNSPTDKALYGTKGKLQLTKYHYDTDEYFSAYEEMGVKPVVDVNYNNLVGVTNPLFCSGKKNRQNTAYSFLIPEKCNPYLDILPNALVTKIMFDDNKNAVGVQICLENDKIIIVKAEKEVILSAGALKTPQLLMVSGIGPKKLLSEKNIEVIEDLPVGNNLQDHNFCITYFKMGKRKPLNKIPNPHILSFPVLDAYIPVNKSKTTPDYEVLSLVMDDPEIVLILCAFSFSFKDEICETILEKIGDKQIYITYNFLIDPKSRGNIRLNTTNLEDQPIVNLGYYTNEEDIEKLAVTAMDFNTILNTTFFKSVNAEFIDPELETCAGMDKESKDYWKCYCSGMTVSGQYFVGTAAMGTVLDSKLLVKGVKKLRVVDASVMPKIVATSTLATLLVIAQKASDMIIKKYY